MTRDERQAAIAEAARKVAMCGPVVGEIVASLLSIRADGPDHDVVDAIVFYAFAIGAISGTNPSATHGILALQSLARELAKGATTP